MLTAYSKHKPKEMMTFFSSAPYSVLR